MRGDVMMRNTVSEVFNRATSTPVPRGMVNTSEVLRRGSVGVREMSSKSFVDLEGISKDAAIRALQRVESRV
jgi:hypothetical protein